MGSHCQQQNNSMGSYREPLAQVVDLITVIDDTAGYTPAVKFGERLRALREAKGLSQPDLAEKSGLSKGQISRWERSEDMNPGLNSIQQLADALEVHISMFFPRPEEESGDAVDTGVVQVNRWIETRLAAIDEEFPADDSVEGDIHKAIAALNRALRRTRTSAAAGGQAQKTGR